MSVWDCALSSGRILTIGLRSVAVGALYVDSQGSWAAVQNCFSLWSFHRCSSWTRLSSCPLRADSFGVQTCRKLWFFTVAVLARWLMSLLVQFIDGCGCPVLMQRRRGSCWRCFSSVHRRGWWTFLVQRLWASSRVGGGEGVGAHHTGDELN